MKLLLILLCVLLTFVLIIIYVKYYRLKKFNERHVISDNLDQNNLAEMCHTMTFSKPKLTECFTDSSVMPNIYAEDVDRKYFVTYFELINKLTCYYFVFQNQPKGNKMFVDEIKNLLSPYMVSKDVLLDLENLANYYNNSIILKFKKCFTNLHEMYYIIFLYSSFGFSAQAISYFLNKDVNLVYNRKSRLKSKIFSSNCQHKDLFLSILGTTKK